ncbi:MAG TPA: hypothetical protein VFP25_01625, partial [Nitrososphaeraceae archaeon]|nr:hypothetical protein [Nitrososphaeraceae archaeon]
LVTYRRSFCTYEKEVLLDSVTLLPQISSPSSNSSYNPETKFTVTVCKFVSNVEICKGFNFSVFYSRIDFIINYMVVFIVKSTFGDYVLYEGKRTIREGI